MIRLREENLMAHQQELVRLVNLATDMGAVDTTRPEAQELVGWFSAATDRPLNRDELERFNRAVQATVALPAYTTSLAAAWAGVSVAGIAHAIWKAEPPLLGSYKPGHDSLVPHSELVRYHQRRS